jgi:hypothetical protein
MSAEPDHAKKGHKVNLKYVPRLITAEIDPVADKRCSDASGSEKKEVRRLD